MTPVPFPVTYAAAFFGGAQTGEGVARTFARFGYAVISLDLAGPVAHNFFHLLAEGKAIYFKTAALFGTPIVGSSALLPSPTIQALQFGVLALGIGGSIFTACKVAQGSPGQTTPLRAFVPQLAVLILFGLVNIYLFTLPMAHRA